MAIKRFYATADNTITNTSRFDDKSPATNANMGLSDSLEVFYIENEVSGDPEEARIIIKFDQSEIVNDYVTGSYTNSKYYLKLFNAVHPYTLPKNFDVQVYSLDTDFDEGNGLDMEDYLDLGYSNWLSASSTVAWNTTGSDVGTLLGSANFSDGTEDLAVDVTAAVTSSSPNLKFVIKMPASDENQYTKKFFARGSQFYFSRPTIELHHDDYVEEQGDEVYRYTNRLDSADNTNTLFFYNYSNGVLKDLPSTDVGIRFYEDEEKTTSMFSASAGKISTGKYSASFSETTLTGSYDCIYGEWYNTSSLVSYEDKTYEVLDRDNTIDSDYVCNITNLKKEYGTQEVPKLSVFFRKKGEQHNVYTVMQKKAESLKISNVFYKITRIEDDLEVIPYTHKDSQATRLSYDATGNFFRLNMSLFEAGYMYKISLARKVGDVLQELPESFKFRVT